MALFFHLQTQQCHISLMGLQSQVGFIYFKKHSDNSEWCLFKVLIHECMKHCHLRQFFKNSLQYILIIFIFPCFQDSSPFPTPNTAVSFFFLTYPVQFYCPLSSIQDSHWRVINTTRATHIRQLTCPLPAVTLWIAFQLGVRLLPLPISILGFCLRNVFAGLAQAVSVAKNSCM